MVGGGEFIGLVADAACAWEFVVYFLWTEDDQFQEFDVRAV